MADNTSMQIFLVLMAVVMLLLLLGGLYLLKDRTQLAGDHMSRSFLARYGPWKPLPALC